MKNNSMFIEVLVRVNGEDKYVDFRKLFDYMIKDKYDGKKIEPCPDRVTKFKEERDYFDLFWINYPKKTSKKDAWNFWKKNFGKLPIKVIMEHCKLAYIDTEKEFVPNPYRYLNKELYYDEIIKPVEKKKPIDLSEFKLNALGEYIGYCRECNGESQFYKDKFQIQKGTHCKCNAKVYPTRSKNG